MQPLLASVLVVSPFLAKTRRRRIHYSCGAGFVGSSALPSCSGACGSGWQPIGMVSTSKDMLRPVTPLNKKQTSRGQTSDCCRYLLGPGFQSSFPLHAMHPQAALESGDNVPTDFPNRALLTRVFVQSPPQTNAPFMCSECCTKRRAAAPALPGQPTFLS